MSPPVDSSRLNSPVVRASWTHLRDCSWIPRDSPFQAWESSDGELAAVTTPVAVSALMNVNLIEPFRRDPNLKAIAAGPDRDTRLPLEISCTDGTWPDGASFLLQPAAAAGPLVFRRESATRIGPLRPLDNPIWDWVIRARLLGFPIGQIPSSSPEPEIPLPRLAPPSPATSQSWLLEHLRSASFAGNDCTPIDRISTAALRAGLLLWHDFLEESHRCSQSIEGEGAGQIGDYWHAIMHRREPDYANAKYWFRQFSPHPLFQQLRIPAESILAECGTPDAASWSQRLTRDSGWDPFAFVDLCQRCAGEEESSLALAARKIQLVEMALLLRMSLHSFAAVFCGSPSTSCG